MKLNEFGLTDGLMDRWLNWKVEEKIEKHFQSINMSQVYLIFTILYSGILASFLISITEYMVYKANSGTKLEQPKTNSHCHISKPSTVMKLKRAMKFASQKKKQDTPAWKSEWISDKT